MWPPQPVQVTLPQLEQLIGEHMVCPFDCAVESSIPLGVSPRAIWDLKFLTD